MSERTALTINIVVIGKTNLNPGRSIKAMIGHTDLDLSINSDRGGYWPKS